MFTGFVSSYFLPTVQSLSFVLASDPRQGCDTSTHNLLSLPRQSGRWDCSVSSSCWKERSGEGKGGGRSVTPLLLWAPGLTGCTHSPAGKFWLRQMSDSSTDCHQPWLQ